MDFLSVLPSDNRIRYSGRIDFTNTDAPVLVYPCSSIRIRFYGKRIDILLTNLHSYYENAIGIILDGEQKQEILSDNKSDCITIGENLSDGMHELCVYKRMDACHYVIFRGFHIYGDSGLLEIPDVPKRRMEFYGDSVTAGEVCEAIDYCGKSDPVHNGEYSNSWYSYAWLTARKLNAEIHDIAQGGIALLENTGYFCGPDYMGMEYMYNKIQYNPYLPDVKEWDFSRYTPHVVVIAIGQNDSHPVDIMEKDIENEAAVHWQKHYEAFIQDIREVYPSAVMILTTTILNHNPNWDRAIENVCKAIRDEKVYHFLYSNNGCGTPGHIRIPEAEKMSDELSAFIRSLGPGIWEDAK